MMGVLPLSFAQKRLWFLDQFEPGSSAYNIPSAVAIEGIFNVEALEESFVEIIKRHEVLRSIFVSPTSSSSNTTVVEGEPRLVIRESVPFMLSLIDLQQCVVVVVGNNGGGNNGGSGGNVVGDEHHSPVSSSETTRRTTTTSNSSSSSSSNSSIIDGGAERERVGLASEEARRPFDLSSGPLLRASVLVLLSNNNNNNN